MNPSAIAQEVIETGLCVSCPIIDLHAHYGHFSGIYMPNHTPEQMLATMARCGVQVAVSSGHTALADMVRGNQEIAELTATEPGSWYGYTVYNPNYPDLGRQELERFEARSSMVGLKLHPSYHQRALTDPAYRPAYEFAASRGLIVLTHTWGGSAYDAPALLAEVAEAYPQITFLAGHSGHGAFDECIAVARRPAQRLSRADRRLSHRRPDPADGRDRRRPQDRLWLRSALVRSALCHRLHRHGAHQRGRPARHSARQRLASVAAVDAAIAPMDRRLNMLEGITWLGHASFRIEDQGKVIYLDPWKLKTTQKADLVLATHGHRDHLSFDDLPLIVGPETVLVCPPDCVAQARESLGCEVEEAKPGDSLLVRGYPIETVYSYNTNKPNHPRDDNHVGVHHHRGRAAHLSRRRYRCDPRDERGALRCGAVAGGRHLHHGR